MNSDSDSSNRSSIIIHRDEDAYNIPRLYKEQSDSEDKPSGSHRKPIERLDPHDAIKEMLNPSNPVYEFDLETDKTVKKRIDFGNEKSSFLKKSDSHPPGPTPEHGRKEKDFHSPSNIQFHSLPERQQSMSQIHRRKNYNSPSQSSPEKPFHPNHSLHPNHSNQSNHSPNKNSPTQNQKDSLKKVGISPTKSLHTPLSQKSQKNAFPLHHSESFPKQSNSHHPPPPRLDRHDSQNMYKDDFLNYSTRPPHPPHLEQVPIMETNENPPHHNIHNITHETASNHESNVSSEDKSLNRVYDIDSLEQFLHEALFEAKARSRVHLRIHESLKRKNDWLSSWSSFFGVLSSMGNASGLYSNTHAKWLDWLITLANIAGTFGSILYTKKKYERQMERHEKASKEYQIFSQKLELKLMLRIMKVSDLELIVSKQHTLNNESPPIVLEEIDVDFERQKYYRYSNNDDEIDGMQGAHGAQNVPDIDLNASFSNQGQSMAQSMAQPQRTPPFPIPITVSHSRTNTMSNIPPINDFDDEFAIQHEGLPRPEPIDSHQTRTAHFETIDQEKGPRKEPSITRLTRESQNQTQNSVQLSPPGMRVVQIKKEPISPILARHATAVRREKSKAEYSPAIGRLLIPNTITTNEKGTSPHVKSPLETTHHFHFGDPLNESSNLNNSTNASNTRNDRRKSFAEKRPYSGSIANMIAKQNQGQI